MAEALTTPLQQEDLQSAPSRVITGRSVLLGVLTVIFLAVYTDYVGLKVGAGVLVKSQFTMAAFIPFVFWLFLNLGLTIVLPSVALTGGELLVIFTMTWLVGTIPLSGWISYWAGFVTAPTYFASPENRWTEVIFHRLPWWLFPGRSHPEVIHWFYNGLPIGESIPWSGWISTLYWWFSASIAMVAFGFCITVIFQKQWVEVEKLTFPLATLPLDLTEGFDKKRGIPELYKKRLFWIGFWCVAGVYVWNMVSYFFPTFPRIGIFDGIYQAQHYGSTSEIRLGPYFPAIYARILPPVIGFTFLCNLDILLSFWAFYMIAVLKMGVMNRTGFSVGLTGQQATSGEIINLESHGAVTFLAIWCIWVARRHLKDVFQKVWQGSREERDDAELVTYRFALIGLVLSMVYILGWFVGTGLSFGMALLHLFLIFIAYLTVMKYIAASGFVYLFPSGVKGGSIIQSLLGTSILSPKNLIGLGVINSTAFFGGSRIPAWPALPHHFKIFERMRRRPLIAAIVFIAFTVGFFSAIGFLVYMCYTEAAQNLGTTGLQGGQVATFDRITSSIETTDKTVFDPQKLSVWIFGGIEAALLAILRSRFYWWPFHPLGLAFQYTSGPRVYSFSIFLAWLTKLVILKVGGIGLYQRAKPFFYGISLGYVIGIAASILVDMTWFPGEGHPVHGW